MATQTGWTRKEILNMNYPTLVLMSADAPRYVQGEKVKEVEIQSEEQLYSALQKKLDK